eukprot:Skav213182  [mRNA]  locus=scaffold11:233236:233676:- [translate_table: standard]
MLSYFSSKVDASVVGQLNPQKNETVIFELEAFAVYLAATALLDPAGIQQNDRVVVFVDNEAVLARLVAGRSNDQVDGRIFHQIFEWEASTGTLVWYERVASHSNVADAPSRGDVSLLDKALAISVDPQVSLAEILQCPDQSPQPCG